MKHIEETNLKLESEEQLKNCEDMHIWVQPIKEYIKELEVKEERAKKVEELLELYRMLVDKEEEYNTSDNTIKRMNLVELLMSLRLEIKALEEEMK